MHTITVEQLEENQIGENQDGICVNCGHVQDGCEPDAREYECENCGENKVYGLMEAVIQDLVIVE